VKWDRRCWLLNFNDVSKAQTQEAIPAGSQIALSGLTCDSNVCGCVMLMLKTELVGLAVFLTLVDTCTFKKHFQSGIFLWAKWYWNRFLSEFFCLFLFVSLHQRLLHVLHSSTIDLWDKRLIKSLNAVIIAFWRPSFCGVRRYFYILCCQT